MGLFDTSARSPRAQQLVEAPAAGAPAQDTPGPDPAEEVEGPKGCPACGGPAYLDYIDLRANVQLEHCKRCREEWTRPIE